MKQHLFLLIFLLLSVNSIGQLEKRTWLVGGSGSEIGYRRKYEDIKVATGYSDKKKGLQLGIGFQLHLLKED